MKAREVRERLKGRCDEQVLFVLEALAEHQGAQKQEIMALAQIIDQVTDLVMQMGVVGEHLKNAVEAVQRKRLPEGADDSGPTRLGTDAK